MFLVVVGIGMQELLGGEIRGAYVALTLGMALLYIHETEFSQQAADSHLHEQHIQITTDALTGVLSRYAYSKALKAFDSAGAPPEDLAVFSIDVNGLKSVNDTLGHDAGDELICGAADCITAAFGNLGKCYRTGGDEFVVLANMEKEQTAEAMARLTWQTARWHGDVVQEIHLAVGCATALEHPGLSAEKLVGVADRAMYAEKAAYYRNTGVDRRRRAEDQAALNV
jgi:diguanylate cyclase (GGDEF)-like protein